MVAFNGIIIQQACDDLSLFISKQSTMDNKKMLLDYHVIAGTGGHCNGIWKRLLCCLIILYAKKLRIFENKRVIIIKDLFLALSFVLFINL